VPPLRSAEPGDASRIRALLEHSGLPTSDLASAHPEFVVAYEGENLKGAGALELFGTTALLRSVVVAADRRGTGLGQSIVRELERRARAAGVTELVLLTQTAASFFQRQSYRFVERGTVAQAVQKSEEFRSLCPANATCMAKTLTDSPPGREREYLRDVRDGLNRRERTVLYVLHETQKERGDRNVPTAMLWGRVCEHFYISPEELAEMLARLGARR
jgi:amino-acid N-acetyltransferase